MTERWINQDDHWVAFTGTDDEWEWLRGIGIPPTAEGEKPEDDA